MKYTTYLKKSGMTNNEVIELLKPHFPKFSKIQCSMLSHPEEYGVQLTPEAKKYLPALPSKPKKPKPGKMVNCGNCAFRWTARCALYIGFTEDEMTGVYRWGGACSDDGFACSKGERKENETDRC